MTTKTYQLLKLLVPSLDLWPLGPLTLLLFTSKQIKHPQLEHTIFHFSFIIFIEAA